MNISAAQLTKFGLKKNVYHLKSKQPVPVTDDMKEGDKYANNLSKKLGYTSEMGGFLDFKDFKIWFSIDAIDNNTAIEIKMLKYKPSDWYFHQSILQSMFYFTLIKHVNKLQTPVFMLNKGYEKKIIDLKKNPIYNFILHFGDDKYQIQANSEVYKHFIKKTKLLYKYVNLEWPEAMKESAKWDEKYKYKEHIIFKENIEYYKLNF